MGDKDVKVTDIKELSDDYVCEHLLPWIQGQDTKGKVLLGTDFTEHLRRMVEPTPTITRRHENTFDEILGPLPGCTCGGARRQQLRLLSYNHVTSYNASPSLGLTLSTGCLNSLL